MNKKNNKKRTKSYSHLTLNDRNIIEEELNQGSTFKEIASILNKDPSTISKEIRRNFTTIKPSTFNNSFNKCEYKRSCKLQNVCGKDCSILCKNCNKCNELCYKFKNEEGCQKLNKPPYVCNGCLKRRNCRKDKFVYKSKEADILYHELLISSRQGINKTETQLNKLSSTVVPLIKKGHSMAAILMNNPDLDVSEKTLYNYVNNGYFSGVNNIDLPRKVKYKPRRKSPKEPRNTLNRENRTYEDYLAYMKNHPYANVVQIDTVAGVKGGKSLLTLIFVNSNFMLAFLIDSQTEDEINKKFDIIKQIFGKSFLTQFEVILTDNGKEFQDPNHIEKYSDTEAVHLFYCDPGKSYQKGKVEKNHELIRYVLPKGESFDHLTQSDVNILMSNINSYPREELNKCCPFSLANMLVGKNFIEKFGYYEISGNDVILTPNLLKK